MLERMAEQYPVGDQGRRILKLAMQRLNAHYVWGTPTKKKILLYAISRGNRRLADIEAVTGFDRREISTLLAELIKRGRVVETREKLTGSRGRPFRVFRIAELNTQKK